ncbi:MAG: TlpA family protein disulfide reductase [Petrimonas sp.]|jgi:thiol-disulfide isomerase/thioredoxin
MKPKTILTLLMVVVAITACAQNNIKEATLENLIKNPILAFHIDLLTIQGVTEKDTLFIPSSDNYVFKKDEKEVLLDGYQMYKESSYHHPYFNVDVVTHNYYDGDSMIFDVYTPMEVSRQIKKSSDLKRRDFEFAQGSLITLLQILESNGYNIVSEKDTIINNAHYYYIAALPVNDTIHHELLINKQQNLPYFLRITTNTFQPFIEEYTFSSFAYPESFDKPQSMLQPIKGEANTSKPLSDGEVVPDWNLNTLSGESFLFENLKGKKTILLVSMINCGPCQTAPPFIYELIEKYKTNPNVDVVVFYPFDPKNNLDKYVKTKEITYPVVYNSMSNETERIDIMNKMQMGMPTFLILDRENKIASRVVGFDINNKDKIAASIEEKLNAVN